MRKRERRMILNHLVPPSYNFFVIKERVKLQERLFNTSSGLIIHSSALEIKEETFLFAGKANDGKSTIVKKLLHYGIPINDDMNTLIFYKNNIGVSTSFGKNERREGKYYLTEGYEGNLKAVFFY